MKLNSKEKEKIIERYTSRFNEYGYSPKTLGWGKGGRQGIRFEVLTSPVDPSALTSVLDVGCGFADYYDFIKERGFCGAYTGVEVVGVLADKARELHPEAEIIDDEFMGVDKDGGYDLAIGSGIFNARCHEDMEGYVKETLEKMLELSSVVAVDFMSTHVDYMQEGAYHADPSAMMTTARSLTKRFVLRCDYMPYEFALILFKDDEIGEDNVFTGCNVGGGSR